MTKLELDPDTLRKVLSDSLGITLKRTSPEVYSYELTRCNLCKKGYVGFINYRYGAYGDPRTAYLGVPALFVGRICNKCESQFKRSKIKPSLGKAERQNKYRSHPDRVLRFYPELKIRHQRVNGSAVEGPATGAFYK